MSTSQLAPVGVEISYRLRLLGWTQTALAKELGVSAGMVNNVVHDRVTCHRVAFHIAELLEQPMQALWPGRYVYKPRAKRGDVRPGEGGTHLSES